MIFANVFQRYYRIIDLQIRDKDQRTFERMSHMLPCKIHDNIQLMHSFEVYIRICQPENSDVHRGEAEVNITF